MNRADMPAYAAVMADDVLGTADPDFDVQLYGLSTVVYAERGNEVLMLKRAGGAMSAQWFLPGGAVDRDELPEDAARRELLEESGLAIEGELELVGAYPMWVYGGDCLQLSYRGRVSDGEVVVSHEHDGARWADPVELRATLTDELIEALAEGDERVGALVRHIRTDLDRYLARTGHI
jgi:8-oxo-dGTP pyrophosphatase MutT (NUDIX family)